MDTENLERRINQYGNSTYWEGGVIVGRECTKCGEIKEIDNFAFLNKKKGTYSPVCKECSSKIWAEKHTKEKRFNEDGLEIRITGSGNKSITYWKDDTLVARECTVCGKCKPINEFSFLNKKKGIYRSRCKECGKNDNKKWLKENPNYYKEWCEKYPEKAKEKNKRRRKEHAEYFEKWEATNQDKIKKYKQKWIDNNSERIKETRQKRYEKKKNENIEKTTNLLKQLNPFLEDLEVKPYGSVYKITNTKTGRAYIGQTTTLLSERYSGDIIKSWVKERKEYQNQKYKEELTDGNFVVEIIDVAICQYHLDKLEAYYINEYDSCNNGYNNNAGPYITDDGIEEFNQILAENGLEFKNGKLIQIKNTHHNG